MSDVVTARRAARLTTLAGLLLAVLALTDVRRGVAGHGLTLAVVTLPVALAPVTVRLLAHPGLAALGVHSRRTTTAGLGVAVALIGLGLALATVAGRPGGGPVPLALTLSTAAALAAATVVLASFHRAGRATPRAARPPGHPRPDLIDDLALVVARLAPGSPAARGLARLNRGLDTWRWSPRRRPAPATRPRLAPATPGRAGALPTR